MSYVQYGFLYLILGQFQVNSEHLKLVYKSIFNMIVLLEIIIYYCEVKKGTTSTKHVI
jgi:hypothetical protein